MKRNPHLELNIYSFKAASDRTKMWPGISGLERRENIFSSYLQIFKQLRQIHRRRHELERKTSNSCMVTPIVDSFLAECIQQTCTHDLVQILRCDRILWYGSGLNQLSYVRGESKFSDHRPVSSIFIAEVESINHSRIQNMNCSSSQVNIDELLQFSNGYTELNFFWRLHQYSWLKQDLPCIFIQFLQNHLFTDQGNYFLFHAISHMKLDQVFSLYLQNIFLDFQQRIR